MLTTNPQDSLFSCFIGHSSGINITTVINKKAVIWACTQINDWCFIQCLLCRVRRGGRHSLELHPRECFGQMWSCLAMSHSPGDGAETAPGWQAAPAQLGIAFPAELQGRWAATGKVGAEGAQRRALAHQLLLLDDGGAQSTAENYYGPQNTFTRPHPYCCLGSSPWAPGGKVEAKLVAGAFGSDPGSRCPWPFRSQYWWEDINHLQGKRKQQRGLNPEHCQQQSSRDNTKPVAGREEAGGGSGAFRSAPAGCCGCPERTPGAVQVA